ncbi:MAG: tRNA (guanosine(46)-N7)-methyltransferase TrmB [Gammaproteobacteria bacterium]|nr:tRNA (guanosine(46)-N7)-methyltransferase TrmB [Gammaproteobacteria bacterium]
MANPIRSFVRRDSRLTRAQKRALEQNWDHYALGGAGGAADIATAFQRTASLTLEVGSGDGACVLELARRLSGEDFIAVEIYRPGLGRLLQGVVAAGLKNVRISDQDICDFLISIADEVFDRVFVFFPDPWPKKRHHKRRLLQRDFFNLLAPRLHRHGRLFVATDCENYARSILGTVSELTDWVNLAGPGRSAPRPNFRPITKFERRAQVAGSIVYDFVFARRACSSVLK